MVALVVWDVDLDALGWRGLCWHHRVRLTAALWLLDGTLAVVQDLSLSYTVVSLSPHSGSWALCLLS